MTATGWTIKTLQHFANKSASVHLLCSYLVGKTNTSTKADTANDEHGQVLGKGTQNGANTEGGATHDHDQLPATNLGDWASEEGEESTCSVDMKMSESRLQKGETEHAAMQPRHNAGANRTTRRVQVQTGRKHDQ